MEYVFLKGSPALGPALCFVVGGHQPNVTMPKIEGRAFSTSHPLADTQSANEDLEIRTWEGGLLLFAAGWPGIRRLQESEPRVFTMGNILLGHGLCMDDWTGVSELTNYITLRNKAGLRFSKDTLANVIQKCSNGAQDWDSSQLGPVDAADLLVQAQETRYLAMAASVVSEVKGFDKYIARPKVREEYVRAKGWHQQNLYMAEQADGIWPTTREAQLALLTQMAHAIELKLPAGERPVVLSFRFTATINAHTAWELLWPQSIDIAWCKGHAIMGGLPQALFQTFTTVLGYYSSEGSSTNIFSVEWKPFTAPKSQKAIPLGGRHYPSFAEIMRTSMTVAKTLDVLPSERKRNLLSLVL